jgi:hypothetical protein
LASKCAAQRKTKYKESIGIQKLIPDLRPYRQETSNANQRDRLARILQYVR